MQPPFLVLVRLYSPGRRRQRRRRPSPCASCDSLFIDLVSLAWVRRLNDRKGAAPFPFHCLCSSIFSPACKSTMTGGFTYSLMCIYIGLPIFRHTLLHCKKKLIFRTFHTESRYVYLLFLYYLDLFTLHNFWYIFNTIYCAVLSA